jgi:hypothetical protein
MLLAEIKKEISAELHAIKNVLKKHEVFMSYEQGDVWQDVQIVEAEEAYTDQGTHFLIVHYGWPNLRTGDINDDWREAELHMDDVHIGPDAKGVWWLSYDAE